MGIGTGDDGASASGRREDGWEGRAGRLLGLPAGEAARAVLVLVVVGIVLRLVLAGSMGLGVDESYAVSVARGLSLSYFDHPPISFWIPGVLAKLAHSENRVLLRLPFILLFAGTTWLMYRLTARLYGERAGLYAALLLNVSPVFSVSTGGWILPDGPLMFFMLGSALCLEHVLLREESGHATAWWLGAGILAGLALLSKYHGIFIVAGAFLFLLTRRESRRWLRRPAPYVAAAIVVVMFLPVLYWNAKHGWISFRFQGGRAVPAKLDLTSFLQCVAGQAGYLLPWIWVPLVWLLVRGLVRGPGDAKRWLLCCLAIGPIAVFTLPSLGGHPGLPHWEAPGYLFLFPLLGAAVDRRVREGARWIRGWLRFSVASFLVLVAIAATQVATGWVTQVAPSLFRRGDPSWQALDWRELKPTLERRGLLADTTRFVGAPSWIQTGKAAYALGPDVPVTCLCRDPHQFRFLAPQREFLGRDAIIVVRTRPGDSDLAARFAPYFRSVEPAGTVTIHRLGRPQFTLTLLLGHDFTRPLDAPVPESHAGRGGPPRARNFPPVRTVSGLSTHGHNGGSMIVSTEAVSARRVGR